MSDGRTKQCKRCYEKYCSVRRAIGGLTMKPANYFILQQCQYNNIKPNSPICKLVMDMVFPKDYIEEVKKILQEV